MSRRRPTGKVWNAGGALILVAAATVMTAACGVSPHRTLDAHSVASEIGTVLARQYQLPAEHVSVHCPGGVRTISGQKFICQATVAGESLSINGRVTSSDGRYTVAPAQAVIVVARAEPVLQSEITAQLHVPVHVSCGTQRVLVLGPGDAFSCTATVEGETRLVTVDVVDLQGNVRYSLAPPTGGPATTSPATLPAS
jgi:hypothetical protein